MPTLLGKKIAARRKYLGMSQNELADGICTQPTLSKIEKKNIAPMTEILVKLCKRLGLTPNDVLNGFNGEEKKDQVRALDSIWIMITHFQFNEADTEFKKMNPNEIEASLKSRYHCIKASIELTAYDSASNALFELGIALHEAGEDERDLLSVSSGFATVYASIEDDEKATYYFNQVLKYADNIKISKDNANDYLKALNNAAKFYSGIGNYVKSNEICERIIRMLKQADTISYVDQSFYRIAFNLYKMDSELNADAIMDNMNKARVLAELTGNIGLLEFINDFDKNKKFSKNYNETKH